MAIHAASAALAALLAVSGGDNAKTVGPAAIPRGFQTFAGAGTVLPLDKVFVPTALSGKVPLVVVLHGCQQDADSIAAVTRWNELAEKEGFMVLYPNQQWGRNPYNCWNWFLPINQAAGVGEPAEIVAAVEAAVLEYPVDPRRVFVAGISAGGAEAATLLSCYPAVFAAGAVHSGVAYGVAATASDALAVMKDGPAGRSRTGWCAPSAYHGGVFVVHGSSDPVIAPSNADRTASDFSGASVEKLIVPGLGHAWSGGAPGLPYSDPKGPDATGLMWAFFQQRTKVLNP